MSGFGGSLCFAPCLVVVTRWFEKRRTFATGIASSGAGFGSFIFPPLVEFLLFYYGFRGTMLILGAIGLHGVLSGIVMVNNKSQYRKKDIVISNPDTICVIQSNNFELIEDVNGEIGSKTCANTHQALQPSAILNVTDKECSTNSDPYNVKPTNCGQSTDLLSNNVNNGSSPSCDLILLKNNENSPSPLIQDQKCVTASSVSKKLKLVSSALGCSIWTDRRFVVFAFCQGFLSLSQTTSHMLVSALAVEMGYTVYEAASFLMFTGVSDTVARAFIGIFLDLNCLRPYRFLCWLLMLALFCIATFVKPFANHYVVMAIACIVSGMGSGSVICQRPVIAYELLGGEKLDSSVAFSIALQGSFVFVGPVIAGKFSLNTFAAYVMFISNVCA